MRRVIAVSLAAFLLAPLPRNPIPQSVQELPVPRSARLDVPASQSPLPQFERKRVSGETGLFLLLTIALKGMHGS